MANSSNETRPGYVRLQHEGTKPKQRKLKTATKGAFTARGRTPATWTGYDKYVSRWR